MFRGLLRPGQGFQTFTVTAVSSGVTSTGRPLPGTPTITGTIDGILSTATQEERETWKQNGHPITHTIVQQYTENKAKPTDVLTLDSRKFMVQGTNDPGEIHHFTIYYVEERLDLV